MSTMTLEQKILAIPTREEFLGGQYYKYVRLEEVLATIDAHLAQPAQATTCAGCGEHKATPLRIDAMGGYVCLTCIDQKLSSLLGEFGYPESQPAQAVDVGAIREVIADMDCDMDMPVTADAWREKLTRALTGEKAGPVDGEVLVAIERGEGYEDVHPDLVAEDCMGNATERGWRWRVVSTSSAPDKEG